jgi:alkylhydroperoxidase/carboxymuconolactone decarboxylase family protein YurZ
VKNRPDENESPAEEAPRAGRTLPFYADLEALAPALLRSQNAWLAQIDSLAAPDRKTHELIRMVCSVIARNPQGVRHHAMLAAEVGATWEEVAGSVVLAEPAFGILVAVEAFPWARKGWERGFSLGDEEEPG